MHHVALDRPGPDDCHLDDEIVVTARPEPRQHGHLRARFDLEHTHRVAFTDHVVHERILGRHGRQRVLAAIETADKFETPANRRQHAEPQHIDLEQA